MNQITKLFQSLSWPQKVSIGLALLTMCGGLAWVVSFRKDAEFKPLYTGMASEDAGVVAQKLRELGVECRLEQNGTAVMVPSGRLDELRLRLAGEGLPKSGRMGFEIFDRTQFGTTDFAEHVNYRRALEGELERTIMSLSEVERARVHITFPKDSVFVDSRQPAKASVLVNLRRPGELSPASVTSITHLVASAVEGLSPESVSVVDRQGRLLSRARFNPGDEAGSSDAALDYRDRVEKAMLAKLNEALEPVLGPTRFRAGVSVDCDLNTVEESEETLDPAASVTLSSQKTEETSGGTAPGGVPGTASNLPRPVPRSNAPSGVMRRSENSTFQAGRKVRHVHQPKGSILRVSVAVLVDHNVRWQQNGTQLARISEPPAPERLKAIRDIAAAVVGLKEERGDQITVEALPFEMNAYEEPLKAAEKPASGPETQDSGWARRLLRQPKMIRYVEGGAFLIAFVAFMLALLRRYRPSRVNIEMQHQLKGPDTPAVSSKQLAGDEAHSKLEEQTLKALDAITRSENGMDTMIEALRRAVEKDSSAAAGVLRGWMFDKK